MFGEPFIIREEFGRTLAASNHPAKWTKGEKSLGGKLTQYARSGSAQRTFGRAPKDFMRCLKDLFGPWKSQSVHLLWRIEVCWNAGKHIPQYNLFY